eukprot:CAMPEP_0174757992 /NCGR_PEP_ID=MMETSP1094-20130205/107540_1 /TAXON_ID=156173 /ORGANISM="Chrysochromulina brevifilum, Strain UTEX LB 985" /LENGTH=247 /DNA_ID=CAMNT_0015963911 /DNA_START=41 /DNA_END=784 /DNA_ORIENTATION=-
MVTTAIKLRMKKVLPTLLFLLMSLASAAVLVAVEGPAEKEEIAVQYEVQQYLSQSRAEKMHGIYIFLSQAGQPDFHGLLNDTERHQISAEAVHNLTKLYDQLSYLIDRVSVEPDDVNWTYMGALYFIFTSPSPSPAPYPSTITFLTPAHQQTPSGRTLTIFLGIVGIISFGHMLESLTASIAYITDKAYEKTRITQLIQCVRRVAKLKQDSETAADRGKVANVVDSRVCVIRARVVERWTGKVDRVN